MTGMLGQSSLLGNEFGKNWFKKPQNRQNYTEVMSSLSSTVSKHLRVLKMGQEIDRRVLKSWDPQGSYGFDSRPRHSVTAILKIILLLTRPAFLPLSSGFGCFLLDLLRLANRLVGVTLDAFQVLVGGGDRLVAELPR